MALGRPPENRVRVICMPHALGPGTRTLRPDPAERAHFRSSGESQGILSVITVASRGWWYPTYPMGCCVRTLPWCARTRRQQSQMVLQGAPKFNALWASETSGTSITTDARFAANIEFRQPLAGITDSHRYAFTSIRRRGMPQASRAICLDLPKGHQGPVPA